MAQHKSAIKRARQSAKANLANRSYMSKVRTTMKKFLVAVNDTASTSAEDLQKHFVEAQSMLMKAASKKVVHKNHASRHISRLYKMMAKRTQKSA